MVTLVTVRLEGISEGRLLRLTIMRKMWRELTSVLVPLWERRECFELVLRGPSPRRPRAPESVMKLSIPMSLPDSSPLLRVDWWQGRKRHYAYHHAVWECV